MSSRPSLSNPATTPTISSEISPFGRRSVPFSSSSTHRDDCRTLRPVVAVQLYSRQWLWNNVVQHWSTTLPCTVEPIECQSLCRWSTHHGDILFLLDSIASRHIPVLVILLIQYDSANLDHILSAACEQCYRQWLLKHDDQSSSCWTGNNWSLIIVISFSLSLSLSVVCGCVWMFYVSFSFVFLFLSF